MQQTAPIKAVPMDLSNYGAAPDVLGAATLPAIESNYFKPNNIAESRIEKKLVSHEANAEKYSPDPLGDFLNLFAIKTFIPDASHFLSIFGNGIAAVANIFDLSAGVKNFCDKFGYFGTKIFLVLNGFINSLEYLHKKDLLGAIGHSLDVIVGIGAKHEHMYLDRGNPVGIYTYANTIRHMNNKKKFETFTEHFEHVKEGIHKSYNNIFSKNFFRNFLDVDKGMFGIFSGILCNIGAIIWHTTGMERFATIVRDFGGFLVDLEQAHPGHYRAGHKFYFYSGLGLMGGTGCDLLAKLFPYYKKSLVPLSLAIDGFGRYLLRVSHNRGEIGEKVNLEKTNSVKAERRVESPLDKRAAANSLAQMAI